MLNINIGKATTNEGIQIAQLHKEYIGSGFLGSLGTPLLELVYNSMIDSEIAFCIVAKDDEKVVGFVSGTTSMSGFYLQFLKDNFFKACVLLLPKFIKPAFMKKILESFFYPIRINSSHPKAELLSIVVDQDYQGKGVSRDLFLELAREFGKKNVNKFKVIVGDNLVPAKKFYEKMGGILSDEIEVHNGEKSKVYIHEC
ncbi:MAG: hypothetical protein DHS20C13_23370 [Thermodesulfobacteriota bacterium]|nr:MAG: hypothetical protein DHS20C13_23370 [Thermodesulfobacteriota bacterium]